MSAINTFLFLLRAFLLFSVREADGKNNVITPEITITILTMIEIYDYYYLFFPAGNYMFKVKIRNISKR